MYKTIEAINNETVSLNYLNTGHLERRGGLKKAES